MNKIVFVVNMIEVIKKQSFRRKNVSQISTAVKTSDRFSQVNK